MKTNPQSPVGVVLDMAPNGGTYCADYGITKREYFASVAMQGILSTLSCFPFPNDAKSISVAIAQSSLAIADAMIDQLNEAPDDGIKT